MKAILLINVALTLAFAANSQIIFQDDFEGATFSSNWVANSGIPNGVVEIAYGIGVNDTRGVRIGKTASSGGFVTNSLDLHLDLSAQTQVALTFEIQDRDDQTHADDGLYFSNNGGVSFSKVFSFKPTDWCNSTYGEFPPFDVDALAAASGLSLTSQFVIRFQQHGDNTLPSNDGFYIDDVKVYVPNLVYAVLPFCDDFEVPSLGSVWTRSFADLTNTLATVPTRPSNIVEITSDIGVNGSRAVRMGKECSDGPATNALDLHLDLSGQTQVEMTFEIQDRNDQTHADDGLYFSNNGGASFSKVFSFKPTDWCNSTYGEFPPFDVDALAAASGLSLTSQFVIRFQQHGDNTLPSNDGFYIDDVKVYVPNLVYAVLPFCDDFEVPSLGSVWTRSFADLTNTLATVPTRPSNIVEITSDIGVNGSRAVRMGKECSDGPATNALDLHLDLLGLGQVTMTFKIQDRNDETQADDALYFSDNGGVSFKKVFSFDFTNTSNVYTDYTIDIDNLATANNLTLSSTFIVRFQQHGNNTLPSNDGIYLDMVCVTGLTGTIENQLDKRIGIYPNPTKDVLFIDYFGNFKPNSCRYQICNSFGELLISGEIKSTSEQVDTSTFPGGVYFIEIRSEEGLISRQFIKM